MHRPKKEVMASALQRVEDKILVIRGQRVMLDFDLATLYGVDTGALNQVVGRNAARFPADFAFRLTAAEADSLKSQFVISDGVDARLGILNRGRGGRRRSTPRAFTEQGVAMLSSVLKSPRAVAVNVEIMRAFVRLRRQHGEYTELARKVAQLEAKYDASFKMIFDAIRGLMQPLPPARKPPIGFRPTRGGPPGATSQRRVR